MGTLYGGSFSRHQSQVNNDETVPGDVPLGLLSLKVKLGPVFTAHYYYDKMPCPE